MSTITLKFSNQKTLRVERGSVIGDFIDSFTEDKDSIIAARINNEICSLGSTVDFDADIEPVMVGTSEGSGVYRRSLCFVLAAAAHEVFHNTRLVVGHSLGYSYYYTIDREECISQEEITSLKEKMQELISLDLCIKQDIVSYKDATEIVEKLGLTETRKQLKYLVRRSYKINSLRDFSDLYFGPLYPSTGKLELFDLLQYQEGFLLQFPSTSRPREIQKYEDVPQLFNVYKRYKDWGKTLGVTSVASLNEKVVNKSIKDFVNITETLQNKCIADIADTIYNRKDVRVILIAGPSSSGKTTTSKKLTMQLQVLGYTPRVIELDTYYIGKDKTPLDEKGNPDYECLEALNVEKLNNDLVALFEGKEIELPAYDFNEGKSYPSGKKMKLHSHEILVLEGIHGLNDKLTASIPAKYKFKIYLSALTQLNLDDHNRISTSDNRLVRRIVRDYNFRGMSAVATMRMWENVHRGERAYIFPFQNNADVMLNTALDYELAVLKVYAEPLLRCVTPLDKEYDEATRILRFLDNFAPIPANLVPTQSIIREFIGGSDFKY